MNNDKEFILYDWTISSMVEIQLASPDEFLKIRETLTRIGISSKKEQKLFQTCHILHKKGRYFIVHFKELFALDGKQSTITFGDIYRRNTIVNLLEQWGFCTVEHPELIVNKAPLSYIKIIPFSEKEDWELVPKYTIGNKKYRSRD